MAAPAPAPGPLILRELSFAETFNKWVESIGIIIAAVWAVYTFVYKEIRLPKAAPINITINLQLKKAGSPGLKNGLLPVELHVSASNPSSRRIYLLSNMWMVWGYKAQPKRAEETDATYQEMAELMNQHQAQYYELNSISSHRSVVAGGSLFGDEFLSPSETVSRTIIFYVPRDAYDSLLAQINLPSSENKDKAEIRWSFDKKAELLKATLYALDKSGKAVPVATDEKGHISDAQMRDLGFQVDSSMSEMSLW